MPDLVVDDAWDPIHCQDRQRRLSYGAAMADADRRMRRGERQALCSQCQRWRWADARCTQYKERVEDPHA